MAVQRHSAPRPNVNQRDLNLPASGVGGARDIELTTVKTQQNDMSTSIHERNGESYDQFIVTWDGENDPKNPLNWTRRQKWSATLTLSAIGFVAILSSSVVAPALSDIAEDLDMTPTEAQMAMSVYVLGLAFSPLVLGPLSEMIGRQPVMHVTNAWFFIWTLAGGFAYKKSTMMAARYFAGIGSSLAYAIGSGVMGDIWKPQQRGRSLGLYAAVPLLGTAFGPLIGGITSQQLSWRWIFYIVAIVQAVVMLASFLAYRETYAPVLLKQKAKALRDSTSNPAWHVAQTDTENNSNSRLRIARSLLRPLHLLATSRVLQVTSFCRAVDYGILYLVLSTFAAVWQERYAQSLTSSSLHYIAFVVGELTAASLGATLTDSIWKRLVARRDNQAEPEYRIPLMLPGAIIMAVGLCLYGWSAQFRQHWMIVDVGVAFIGCGLLLLSQATQAYVIDAFPEHVSSASSANQLLSSLFAFCFPLFAPQMYKALGFGWGNTLLCGLALVLGLASSTLLWTSGAKMRSHEPGRQAIL